MRASADRRPLLSRRATLSGVAGAATALAMGGLGQVARAADGATLDQMVVDTVRRKFPDFSRPLNVLLPNGSRANLAPLVTEFTQNTGIEIELIEVDINGINAELMLDAMLDGRKYDVALPATFGLSDLVLAGAVQPLDMFRDTYEPSGFRRDILFNVGDSFEGQTFGFQTDGDAYLMFYNNLMLMDQEHQKAFEDRFSKPLDIPLTWEELDRQMAFFHDPDRGKFGGALFRTPQSLVWEWWLRLHAKGIWPLSLDMVPQIADDAGIAALEEMIAATQYQVPGSDTHGVFQNWDRFSKGDIYANIGWGGTQKYLNGENSAVRGKLSFGPTPGGQFGDRTVPMPYFNWGWNYVVSTASADPELAYLFCLFASSPRMSTCAVRQVDGFFDPFRPEHYADPGIIDAYSEPFLTVHRQALEGAIPDFYLKRQSEYFSVLTDGLDRALQGEVPPKAALSQVAQKWELITSHTGRAEQIAQWGRLRAQYPRVIREVLRDLT